MLFRDISKILANFFFGFTIALLIPLFVAAFYQFIASPDIHPQPHSTVSFLITTLISLGLTGLFYRAGKEATGHLYRREGLIIVAIIWFLTPAIGALPFYLSGTLNDPLHAYFEATSGLTTTGATTMQAKKYNPETGEEIPIQKILEGAQTTIYSYWGTITPIINPENGELIEGIEAVSKALLFWRSFMQWLGGMGIVVLFIAVLPALGVGGKVLFQAEVPGPTKEALTPRIKETAIQLWRIYIGLSLLQTGILLATNSDLSWFDAFSITFSTMSTGGFTAKTASIGGYNNVYTDWIIILFMILAGINFSLYFYSLRGKFYRLYEPEFLFYLIIIFLSCGFVSWYLQGTQKILMTGDTLSTFSTWDALRYGSFQTISALTTTGFVTADYDLWPYTVQVLLLIVMYIGGMSGSTAGGMKVIRLLMLFRISQYKVESIFRPEAVRRFMIGQREVDPKIALMVSCYFVILIGIAVASTFLFVIDGMDIESSLALVTLLINNIGIGFRMASPTESAAFLTDFGLIYSCLLMVFGRLEFLAILAIMVPAFWQQNK